MGERTNGENEWIRRMLAALPEGALAPPVRVAELPAELARIAAARWPGDDCAVVFPDKDGGEMVTLLKTDALIEGVHFLPDEVPERVGWKAIARARSDFAAMGAGGGEYLVTMVVPRETDPEWLEGCYRGIGKCLVAGGAILVGGETSSTAPEAPRMISIAARSQVHAQECVIRSGGKAGDAVFVTGQLGGSLAGKHLDFIPREAEGTWLAREFRPTAMMDLSDGLAMDLPRLAEASGCGFVLDRAAVPCTPGSSLAAALSDGEDFELLFTIDPERVEALMNRWKTKFPELRLTAIGRLVERHVGERTCGGWDHFR